MNSGTRPKLLEASSLVKKYGSFRAVDKLNLSLEAGRCLALLGPNGAGKTTTCEMLEGLTAPDQGQIHINGLNYQQHRSQILERTGVQLQETRLYGKFTVSETFELFASLYPRHVDLSKLTARLGLTKLIHKRLGQLSGGQQQRVYMGCAMIHDPDLLFLDEPTSGLDPQSRHAIWDILEEAKAQGKGIFLTTHYMEEAQRLADHIAIIDQGQIIAQGSLEQLIKDHCYQKIVSLSVQSSSQEQLQKLRSYLEQVSDKVHGAGSRFEVFLDNFEAFMEPMTATLKSLGLTLKDLNLRQGSLEDVFLTLTGRSMRDESKVSLATH